uniref:Putative Erf family protein n=1 Tax=viral metagenome TaxID=1070528 RepID=A0A6H1ZNX4_9ZZZZ
MKKLHEIQQELVCLKKRTNDFGHYKYRSCEDILNAVKPLLGEEADLLLFDELVLIGDRYYVKATVKFSCDGEIIEVSAFAREPLVKKGMDEPQITGTASSYARKYALNGMFLIDDAKDADDSKGINGPPKPTKEALEVIKLVAEKLIDSVPDGFILDESKVGPVLYALSGKYPTEKAKVGTIAAWLIAEKAMNSLCKERETQI